MSRKIDFEVVVPQKAAVQVTEPHRKAAEVRLPGVPGVAGRSAYQLAVNTGFEGTLEEWLASLKGEPGAPGKDGYSPVRGVDYFTAADVQAMVDEVTAKVEAQATAEEWVFTLEDGSTVTKKVYVQ